MPGPAYRIVTPRLVIRCPQPQDAEALREATDSSLAELRAWLPWAHEQPETLVETRKSLRSFRARFDADEDYLYLLFDLPEERCLGGTGLHTRRGPGIREIGYWLRTDATGAGLMTESSAALTRVAFELDGVRRVEIRCDPLNAASAAIPRRLGFVQEGTHRHDTLDADGTPRDTMVFGLTRDGYPASPCAQAELAAFDAVGEPLPLVR